METMKKDKRKILLVLPLLVLPFLAFAFYAMGGGKGTVDSDHRIVRKGINTDLPDASFKKDGPTDKLDFYRQADRDRESNADNGIQSVADRLGFNVQEEDPQTEAIHRKLEELNKEISKPAETNSPELVTANITEASGMKSDVDRLEALMKSMQESKGEDPEMVQLNRMLQSILDIQHPDRVQQRMVQTQPVSDDSLFKAIPAIIVDKQKAVQGATIKIRIQDSIRINGMTVPKGHDLFGICRITNQRLLLDIKNIRLGTSIIPVDLSVYSLDGMAGINAPEAMLAGAAGNGADDAVRGMRFMDFDQSIGAQAAGAGIDAAKTLFSKKIKRIKVKLDAGTAILLRNNKPNKSIH